MSTIAPASSTVSADEQRVIDLTQRLLDEHPPSVAAPREFLGAQFDLGLAWIHFPEGQGGLGLSPRLQEVVNGRLRAEKAPMPGPLNPIGYGMGAPTVVTHGSEQQKARYLRPLFTGEEVWCQLFSEPGAGSDVASLSTRAVRDGDEWIINGQKVWTTVAHLARWGMLVARTDPDAPKHRGMTYFVVDMTAPGVEVRPLRQATGEAEFNEVYFTDVRIPDSERLGGVGEGWHVSLTTLMNERVSIGGGIAPRGSGPIGEAVRLWKERHGADHSAGAAVLRDRVVDLWIKAEAARLTNIRASENRKVGIPGPEGSVGKLVGAELNQKIYELCIDLMGLEGILYGSYEMTRPELVGFSADIRKSFIRARGNSIEGGTSEVMRNILGERVLGLPGEPRVDKDVPWSEVPRKLRARWAKMSAVGLPIEDYAMIGDTRTGALVGRNGSIDWWCVPRFDKGACFAALLGDEDNGCWRLSPAGAPRCTRRQYRHDSLILESEWETAGGSVRVIDHMPMTGEPRRIVRVVEGLSGSVDMEMELVIRFDYGHIVPWVRQVAGATIAVAGPDSLCLRTPVEVRGENMRTKAAFRVEAGTRIPFVLTWHPSHEDLVPGHDPEVDLAETETWWETWSSGCRPLDGDGRWHDAVRRSLITLKGLTYTPTGGIVAALTTSLPEALGGVRNWDYRFCWLRDATFSLYALLLAGYESEATAWRDWLLRAVAGRPDQFQILYGPAGERRLTEWEVPWLGGYEHSRPVRIGNAAANQFQLDVFGEVMDTLSVARRVGMAEDASAWDLQRTLISELEGVWEEPDEGIWEVRGPRRHFVHSKVMAWVAMDRAVHAAEAGLAGDLDRWRSVRDTIHAEVCKLGFNREIGSFTQFYGSKELDASLLMIPQVGFLPIDDPRVQATIRAIEKELCREGLVLRYGGGTRATVDGLPPGEGAFLPCSFWLADAWAMSGRTAEATALFDRLLGLRNDVGLLSEEYDVDRHRQVGNFPQAFSHLSLVNTARNLTEAEGRGAAAHRSRSAGCPPDLDVAPADDRPSG